MRKFAGLGAAARARVVLAPPVADAEFVATRVVRAAVADALGGEATFRIDQS